MDRSFIVEAQMKEGQNMKDVVAVVFLNSVPEKALLGDLGLATVKSVEEVKPLSKQPTEPTMYVFGHQNGCVKVVRFDWQGKVTGEANPENLDPRDAIPPVEGNAAERLLYLPTAYVIMAHVKDGPVSKPVVGVMISKPFPGKKMLKADKKTLDKAGFVNIQSVDTVTCQGPATTNSLYIFERVPQPSSVRVFDLNPDGSVQGARTLSGEPREIIPALKGAAADRFIYAQNGGLSKSDFPRRQSTIPPASTDQAAQKKRC
jgi:hypothetical protein